MWKTSIVVWSLILYSPIIFLLGIDFIERALKNVWNTLYGYSWVQSLYIVAGVLPFAVPIWILGTWFLHNFSKKVRMFINLLRYEN